LILSTKSLALSISTPAFLYVVFFDILLRMFTYLA
jgi:hypothetical protein